MASSSMTLLGSKLLSLNFNLLNMPFIRVMVGSQDSFNSWVFFSGSSSRSFLTLDKLLHWLIFFSSNSGDWYMFLCITPIPCKPRCKMQLTLSTGFLQECPAAVHEAMIMSELSDFWSNTITIFTDRKFVWCSGPLSVYIIMIGGMFLLVPNFLMRALSISTEFCMTQEGSLAVILMYT